MSGDGCFFHGPPKGPPVPIDIEGDLPPGTPENFVVLILDPGASRPFPVDESEGVARQVSVRIHAHAFFRHVNPVKAQIFNAAFVLRIDAALYRPDGGQVGVLHSRQKFFVIQIQNGGEFPGRGALVSCS